MTEKWRLTWTDDHGHTMVRVFYRQTQAVDVLESLRSSTDVRYIRYDRWSVILLDWFEVATYGHVESVK